MTDGGIERVELAAFVRIAFTGESSDSALDEYEAELRRWMKSHGLRAAGPVEHAFYGSPLTPRRRNEVLIPLAAYANAGYRHLACGFTLPQPLLQPAL